MAEVVAGQLRNVELGQRLDAEEHIDPAVDERNIAAAVAGDDLDLGEAFKEPVDGHARDGDGGVVHEARARHENPFVTEVDILGAEGRGGMNQDRESLVVQCLPHRLEKRVDEVPVSDMGDAHDPDRALADAPLQFGDGRIGVFPGQ